jgi:hypothetical protein
MTHLAKGFPFVQRFALRNRFLACRERIRHSAGRFDLIAWHPRAHDRLVSRPRQALGNQESPDHQRNT